MKIFKICSTAGLSCLSYLFGGLDSALLTLTIMMALDYATGFIAAAINKELDSRVGSNGILRKTCLLVAVILAVQVEKIANLEVGILRGLVCYSLSLNEGVSIVENLERAGVEVPFLSKFIKDLKKKDRDKKKIK